MYWELKKTKQKNEYAHFQGDKGHGAISDVYWHSVNMLKLGIIDGRA